MRRTLTILTCAVVTVATFARADWRWELSNKRYQRMNVFERAQYDKAAALLRQANYKAAASEFEKFKIQFPDSEDLPYILFMIGYSRHQNRERYKAIQTYDEVLDYFGDVIDDASAALYFQGIAHIDNGDVRKGMVLLKEMVQDEDYQTHPLAAGALRRLADNEWRNENHEEAVRYWKQVVRDFDTVSQNEARVARANVTGYYIKKRDYTGYEDWLISAENRDDVRHRKWVAQNAWGEAWNNFHHSWGKYNNFNRDEKQRDMQALLDWFKNQKAWYEKGNDEWSYYHNALLFLAQRMYDRKGTRAVLEEAVPVVKKIEADSARDDRFCWLVDRLREAQNYPDAIYCIGLIKDPAKATYERYEVFAAQSKWEEAFRELGILENSDNADWVYRALGEHARVYKDVLRQYDKAITLYQKIDRPPGTLWAIQECYKRWGKLKESLTVLSEIENSFPDDAPNAAWHKASYLDEAGERKQAIGQARRILAVYPKSAASSSAHQLLEKYGIATGGGVADNE